MVVGKRSVSDPRMWRGHGTTVGETGATRSDKADSQLQDAEAEFCNPSHPFIGGRSIHQGKRGMKGWAAYRPPFLFHGFKNPQDFSGPRV